MNCFYEENVTGYCGFQITEGSQSRSFNRVELDFELTLKNQVI